MVVTNAQNQRSLQLSLYSGIALIVVSMLFLGRGQESFVGQAITVLAAPLIFYVVGALIYRYLQAPLAAPGIVATGAWLVGVGLIHLYDKRTLMPDALQPYYWLVASLLAGVLITLTGHRVQFWMLRPLVPLVQVNAVWATMGALGIPVQWMPPFSFVLVLAWWESPAKDERWITAYRISAVLLSLFLLVFTIWLPLTTAQTLMATWGAGAVLVAVLGIRHGLVKLGPLAIVMLTCASIWGLPASLWVPVWLVLAAGTVLYVERLGSRDDKTKDARAMEMSEALAIVLSGVAALFAQLASMLHIPMHPLGIAGVLAGAGTLLVWLGWRRGLRIAAHSGLWLIASAWATVYFVAVPRSGTYGLWLALFASGALLADRLFKSARKDKHKDSQTLVETVTHWPIADLVIGLTSVIVLWTALNISSASPWVLAITISVVIGVWVVGGLIYRLPILLHTALWLAPLPYALLLILAAPWLWTLPLLGIAWQLFGATLLILGHSMPRYRPAVVAPFFIVGYALSGFGFTLSIPNATLLPASLTLLIVTCMATSVAVIADRHPVWSAFVARLISPDDRPYAFRSFNHLFLLLTAWLAAIWLHLMLGYAGLPLPHQGMLLVVFSCAWFLLGRLVSRLPGVVGWPIIGAGWLMWLIGLLEVFFSPTDAIITMILGLAISGEALRRSKEVYWIPVFIIQGLFTALQIAWLLALPGHIVLLLLAVGVSAAGMFYERQNPRAGQVTAATGAALAVSIWSLQPTPVALLALNLLTALAVLNYRRWQWLWAVYLGIGLQIYRSGSIDWRALFVAGIVQLVVGVELVRTLRPRQFRTLRETLARDLDWATPLLWIGLLCTTIGLVMGFKHAPAELLGAVLLAAVVSTWFTVRLRIPKFPYIPLALTGIGVGIAAWSATDQPFGQIGSSLLTLNVLLTLASVVIRWICIRIVRTPSLLAGMRWLVWWLRPLLGASFALSAISLPVLLIIGSFYHVNAAIKIANGLLLTAFAALVYRQQRRQDWLWATLGMAWYCWWTLVAALGTNSILWHTLPVGVILLAVARMIGEPHDGLVEIVGTLALVAGGLSTVDRMHLLSSASLLLIVHLLGLVVYGYLARRRLPFISASVLLTLGLLYVVVRINPWLIPLLGGVLLIAATLLVEVRHELAEGWVTGWVERWRQWN
jgi:hypothetical protein